MLKVLQLPEPEEFRIESPGATLVGSLFRPAHTPDKLVLIHGATGVPQGFYRAFASWLASEGAAVITYDYRDFGRSANRHVRHSKATIRDWVLLDQVAAQSAATALFPDLSLWVVGHSLGGLFIPWHSDPGRIDRLITVASGPVHVSDHPFPYQLAARAFWFGPGAIATKLLGYTPGKALGMGADLPPGVYWQWRSACLNRDPVTGIGNWATDLQDRQPVTCKVKFVAIADDVMVPKASVWKLMGLYPDAFKSQLTLGRDGRKIGHLGAFRRAHADIWPELMA